MTTSKIDRESAGLVYQAFADEIHERDEHHPLGAHFKANLLERQALVNDPKTNRMLIVDHSQQMSVVSFPTIALDIKTKVLSLHGLLGTNCLLAVPIKVLGNTIKYFLTFAIVDEDATGLRATPDHASRADADVDHHPSPGSTLVQIPMMLPLVGNMASFKENYQTMRSRLPLSSVMIWRQHGHK